MHSIRDILREKGAKVRSIDPGVTVFDALQQMAEHGIGALLVLENGKPVGLFSERDYARKLALRGLRSRDTPVSAIMSSPVLTIRPDASVQEGLEVMTEKYVRHLPVVCLAARHGHTGPSSMALRQPVPTQPRRRFRQRPRRQYWK